MLRHRIGRKLGVDLFPRRHIETAVISFGGCGSTTLLAYLRGRQKVNSHNSEDDGLAHANAPRHPVLERLRVERAVYLYADPVDAILSLFRRGFQTHMIPKLNSSEHCGGADYRQTIRRNRAAVTLDAFLDEGRDQFGIARHWFNWRRTTSPFPAAFVSFDALFEEKEALCDFLGLGAEDRAEFPRRKRRNTSRDRLAPEQHGRMEAIYADVIADMATLPGLVIRPAETI